MRESTMKEKIERYIHRKYGDIPRYVAPEETDKYGEKVDIIFIEGNARSLHIIEAEPTFERCFNPNHGFTQVDRFRANYKWLALPSIEISEYRKVALFSVCKKFGFGLMYAYKNQVREIIQPATTAGNFLKDYPYANLEWHR